ncbi:MAG: hypothetical protein ACFFE8_09085 [Candidatus Heimdallarchaeota archaeon]
MPAEHRPLMYEKIAISPKRFLTVKLWPPTAHPQWGITRASIEIQESRIGENNAITYGQAIRLPCSGSTALVATYLQQYLLEGRRLNLEGSSSEKETPVLESDHTKPETSDIKEVILSELAGLQTSKSRAYKTLQDQGHSLDKYEFYTALEELASEGKIQKEQRTLKDSKDTYDLWIIPPQT